MRHVPALLSLFCSLLASGESAFAEVGSVSSPRPATGQLALLVGRMDMKADREVWAHYYSSRPLRLGFLGTRSVAAHRYGELGLGVEGAYSIARGQIPKVLRNGRVVDPETAKGGDEAKEQKDSQSKPRAGQRHVAYGFSFAGVVAHRFFLPAFPHVSLHPSVSYGAEWMELALRKPIQGELFRDKKWPLTTSFWKPVSRAKLALELSLGSLSPREHAQARYSSGLQDTGLVAFVEYGEGHSKMLSSSALTVGTGLTFRFE